MEWSTEMFAREVHVKALLENEKYVQQEGSSGRIALDVRFVSDCLGWRSVHSRRSSIFRELRR
jgi:hypothetical protein